MVMISPWNLHFWEASIPEIWSHSPGFLGWVAFPPQVRDIAEFFYHQYSNLNGHLKFNLVQAGILKKNVRSLPRLLFTYKFCTECIHYSSSIVLVLTPFLLLFPCSPITAYRNCSPKVLPFMFSGFQVTLCDSSQAVCEHHHTKYNQVHTMLASCNGEHVHIHTPMHQVPLQPSACISAPTETAEEAVLESFTPE